MDDSTSEYTYEYSYSEPASPITTPMKARDEHNEAHIRNIAKEPLEITNEIAHEYKLAPTLQISNSQYTSYEPKKEYISQSEHKKQIDEALNNFRDRAKAQVNQFKEKQNSS